MSHRIHQLLACQWGAVVALAVCGVAVGWKVWGIGLPVLAYVVGTAAYVWWLAPDASLVDREELKALAWGAGARGGVLLGLLGAAVLPGADEGGPDGWGVRLALSVLLAVLAAATLTILSLVGLDAGRSRAL